MVLCIEHLCTHTVGPHSVLLQGKVVSNSECFDNNKKTSV